MVVYFVQRFFLASFPKLYISISAGVQKKPIVTEAHQFFLFIDYRIRKISNVTLNFKSILPIAMQYIILNPFLHLSKVSRDQLRFEICLSLVDETTCPSLRFLASRASIPVNGYYVSARIGIDLDELKCLKLLKSVIVDCLISTVPMHDLEQPTNESRHRNWCSN